MPSVVRVRSPVKLEFKHDSFRWSRMVRIAPASDGHVLDKQWLGNPSVDVPSIESPLMEQRAESNTNPLPLCMRC